MRLLLSIYYKISRFYKIERNDSSFSLSLRSFFNNQPTMHYILFLLILYGLGELSIGIRQILVVILNNYSYRAICGTFHNPAPYTILITIILPIAWFNTLHWKMLLAKKEKIFIKVEIFLSSCYTIMSLVVLPFCMNRTSWIAAILACGIVTLYYLKENKEKEFYWDAFKKRFIILIIFSFVCISGIYFLKKDSADGRLLIWKISSSIVKEHFVCGASNGSFPGAYGKAQEEYFRNNRSTEHERFIAGAPEYAYNEYLQITIEYGIVGLLILILIIGYSFYHLTHTNNPNRIPIIGAFVSLLIIAFFSYPFRNPYTCLLSVCIIILATLLPNRKTNTKNLISSYGILLFVLCFIFYKVCISFGLLGNMQTAYRQWNLLKPYFEAEQFDEITGNYAMLYPYLKLDAAFLFEYGQCLSKVGQYKKSNQILQEGLSRSSDPMFLNILGKNYQQLGKYQLAEEMLYRAYYRIPHKIYSLYLLMLLYKEQQKEQNMLYMAYRIVNQKEKINSSDTKYVKAKAKEILEQYKNKRVYE